MDDESRWNPAPQNKKTVEDSNVPPSYAHYHMHQGTSTQKLEISDKKPTRKKQEPVTKTITVPEPDEGFSGYVLEGVPYSANKQFD